jgi:hypothetical protein
MLDRDSRTRILRTAASALEASGVVAGGGRVETVLHARVPLIK